LKVNNILSHNALTNHGTVLNFQAILSRLDFIYSDKRPIHILESELSILRQGRMTITLILQRSEQENDITHK